MKKIIIIVIVVLFSATLYFLWDGRGVLEEEKSEEDIFIVIEELEERINLKVVTKEEIYIPKRAFSSPPYLLGPWLVQKWSEEKEEWEALIISDMCVGPMCGKEKPFAACSPIPHPPFCDTVIETISFEWEKEHFIRDEVEHCYFSVSALPGEYKAVFFYKDDPCQKMEVESFADYTYETSEGVFQDNIKTVEETFRIE